MNAPRARHRPTTAEYKGTLANHEQELTLALSTIAGLHADIKRMTFAVYACGIGCGLLGAVAGLVVGGLLW